MIVAREAATGFLDRNQQDIIDKLKSLVAIYSCSHDLQKHRDAISSTADRVKDLAMEAGLQNVTLLTLDENEAAAAPGHAHGQFVPPCVYGENLDAGEMQPTVLFYAHYDVMPIGDRSDWHSDPLVAELKNVPERGGDRLYGRGTADDKGGLMAILSALRAVSTSCSHLPINVKIIFEGEEEIGSVHLPQYLEKHRDLLAADVLVLADTDNIAFGTPCLTYSLRGCVDMDVDVRVATQSSHSGSFGGPVVDAATCLCRVIATLHDKEGNIAVEGFSEGIRKPTDKELRNIGSIKYDEHKFREECGLLPGVQLAGDPDTHIFSKVWLQPAINVIGIDAADIATCSNRIIPHAKARISCRIAANQDVDHIVSSLQKHLVHHAPFGAHISFPFLDVLKPWVCVPEGPAFAAAEGALRDGFGCAVVYTGCGGTIGFVEPFQRVFGNIPALLLGVEDPYTNAHGENESVLLPDLFRTMRSLVFLLFELADTYKSRRPTVED
eukprot:CAMPEP_0196659044 /NCGR_PEP_ID=MMETSP1086-20130531/32824_1 /TAXON_ID=77921 /ORGANISM="Cyanoptyche  gloeocystis , Strain SAG4.97" /LENGTH=495 /DNA_ID=CAMNT_0041992867 /DNA_START=99 /DNA_END=1586 /DNA_ORIENTATION=-